MGIKDCQILLDNQWNTYYPGQTINGRVEYTLTEPKKVSGISIQFKGGAETTWQNNAMTTGSDGKSRQNTVTYSGKEEYFSITYYLIGSKSGNEIEIPAQKNIYPFTCALPPTLPSSFEGEFGFVRYTIKITLDRPWKFDLDLKMAFTVVSHLDLNMNPGYRTPINMHMEKTFCCCWCKSGPLVIDVGMPVSAYCSGQTIPFDVSCENGSNVGITDIKIYFKKIVKFRCQTPQSATKEQTIDIAQISLGPTLGNSSKNWREAMEIPPLPPSNLVNCSLIDLDYQIVVICEVSGAHMNLQKENTIFLGTVPLVGFEPPPPTDGNQVNAPVETPPSEDYGKYPSLNPVQDQPMSYPNAPGQETSHVAPPPAYPGGDSLYPSIAPPTFREGQFAAKTIHDNDDHQNMAVHGRSDFAPRYPTYGTTAPRQ